mgnify:CR=1 FL=1
MSAYNDKRRNLKRPYRKKALQTGMSQISSTVESHPLPEHSYSTSTHQQTEPFRKGIDARTYERDVRPAVESLEKANVIDSARYPWHLVPKADSGNVIARTKFSFADTNIDDKFYMDLLVLNVADVGGSNISTPTALPDGRYNRAPAPQSPGQNTGSPGTETPSGTNPRFPNTGDGRSVAGVAAGTVTVASPGEYYKISSFGHSNVGATNLSGATAPAAATPVVYQIWVDGNMFMEWQNFQWSAVTPKQDQWHFDQPIGVARQIVFRVINQTGQNLDAGDCEVCFSGWSENVSSVTDIGHTQLENVA